MELSKTLEVAEAIPMTNRLPYGASGRKWGSSLSISNLNSSSSESGDEKSPDTAAQV